MVATPDGRGVIAAVLTDDFEIPQPEAETDLAVDASDDRPAHVVGLERGGSAVYRASALRASSVDEGEESVDDEAVTPILEEDVEGLESLPEGWDRESVLEYWSSIGGSWEECTEDVVDEFGEERAREHCSAMKDEVLGTARWRNRF